MLPTPSYAVVPDSSSLVSSATVCDDHVIDYDVSATVCDDLGTSLNIPIESHVDLARIDTVPFPDPDDLDEGVEYDINDAPGSGLGTAVCIILLGSAWTMLSRSFVEYCIIGYDNLPRTLLMYYTNFLSTPEGYFQTVICNSEDFSQTVANHDLHYIAWDRMPGQHPHWLSLEDFDRMVESNVPFARKFEQDNPVLDKIDAELLGRGSGDFVPGGWCGKEKTCDKVKNSKKLRPGKGSFRLGKLLHRLVRTELFKARQCVL